MTKTINLRDMPESLVRRAKAHAALGGVSLKAFVIQALEVAVAMSPEVDPKQNDKERKEYREDKKDRKEKKKAKKQKKEKKKRKKEDIVSPGP